MAFIRERSRRVEGNTIEVKDNGYWGWRLAKLRMVGTDSNSGGDDGIGIGGAEEVGGRLGDFSNIPSLIWFAGMVVYVLVDLGPKLQKFYECPGDKHLEQGRFS
ncbi:hypothetical protein AAC387_Pa12g1578 [Persea americana]